MQAKIEKKVAIRLKVTEKCPWQCKFCHKEGGWGLEDILWSNSTRTAFEMLKEKLNVTEIHFTGGEPTVHRQLAVLTSGLVSQGFKVKTTTNGQFGVRTLSDLMQSGLRNYNFSVLSISPETFIESQSKGDLGWAKRCVDRQQAIIEKAVELGANVKINTVVSTKADIARALEVYHFAKAHNILIRFLNDLGNGSEAVGAIDALVAGIGGATELGRKVIAGSSSISTYYEDKGFTFGVKGIRRLRLKSLCRGCHEACTEEFYGIRMEQKRGTFIVRLCLNRSDEKSVMTLDDFFGSKQFMEIKGLLC